MAVDAAGDLAFLAATARRSIADLRSVIDSVPMAPGRRGAHFLAVIKAALDSIEKSVGDTLPWSRR